ncbi:MAG: 1-(5-phosphoribosyl)-5-[(5-phosphoribosylamino)methylideneamino] imidazole-4-carboxamide isomerase [Sinobacteraceae bacterium]|nr:1-(5-phosphoribosyl)-5-[(5-phosphoribosylamino)methylideneamino] imidazole-4-carboxamide isomerase [Nevskiaceae bacterium]MBV9911962.1 1-(5-phosphoribosyl)-5-[(5-phosphoribosylamino)methylideneamino] imidazole-4-carboxamide isomerase [Nevskiaceae bacterium]
MLLIPALDLRGGRCVRLYQGDFAAETQYPHEPGVRVQQYRALGASWIHIVDLDGARQGQLQHADLIAALATIPGVQLQFGGGVRNAATVEQLLQLGVARVVIGSAAIEQPAELYAWIRRYGATRFCVAMDVRCDAYGIPNVRTRGWQHDSGVTLWDALARRIPAGVRHVLCTDVERDGTLQGPNIELYREAQRRHPQLQWQASGGIRDAADLHALAGLGIYAAVSGKALLEGHITSEELRPFLHDASSPASTFATARS